MLHASRQNFRTIKEAALFIFLIQRLGSSSAFRCCREGGRIKTPLHTSISSILQLGQTVDSQVKLFIIWIRYWQIICLKVICFMNQAYWSLKIPN